ncbi:hypothetical protein SCB71_03930 [Herbiconiux sp. KACC 21604]|uniref:hypothetical protein n=1 Tax=unclassified Herbiconiux TaxID=2618217 RepID=UPI001490A793|nr:hypothetical protein [Herbiconiux sp. SALV-R1]QJU52523.1 hypothetical protein HL652_01895 [Herbiconiux sp. SALV-R1]WPO87399.1 hypothetical protein SCB71_03930 [Herbiconiux sp. KACC 21604]
MSETSRRSVLQAGVWSIPAVALAVAAPAAAASVAAPTVTITGIVPTGVRDVHELSIRVDDIPPGSSLVTGRVTWTPSGGRTIGSSIFLPDSSGNASVTLTEFPPGVLYLFTASVFISGTTITTTYPYTF